MFIQSGQVSGDMEPHMLPCSTVLYRRIVDPIVNIGQWKRLHAFAENSSTFLKLCFGPHSSMVTVGSQIQWPWCSRAWEHVTPRITRYFPYPVKSRCEGWGGGWGKDSLMENKYQMLLPRFSPLEHPNPTPDSNAVGGLIHVHIYLLKGGCFAGNPGSYHQH